MIDKVESDLHLPTAGVEDTAWRELKSLLRHRITVKRLQSGASNNSDLDDAWPN